MATTDDTSKTGPTSNQTEQAASAAAPPAPSSAGNPNSPSTPQPRSTLEQAIEAERKRLLQAHGVLKCLYEVLLYADGDDAVSYAEAAHVAATLIEESVARLDVVHLRPMIEALKRSPDNALPKMPPNRWEVREPDVAYLC